MSVHPLPITDLAVHPEPVVNLAQLCDYFHVNRRTALKWVAAGHLKAFKLPGRGDWRVTVADARIFVDQQQQHSLSTVQSYT